MGCSGIEEALQVIRNHAGRELGFVAFSKGW
jgi:hypothetical protein